MAKTRYDRVPRDVLKELITGRQKVMNLSGVQLAKRANMSREHFRGVMRKPSSDWTIGDTLALSAALDIPIAETREAIRK